MTRLWLPCMCLFRHIHIARFDRFSQYSKQSRQSDSMQLDPRQCFKLGVELVSTTTTFEAIELSNVSARFCWIQTWTSPRTVKQCSSHKQQGTSSTHQSRVQDATRKRTLWQFRTSASSWVLRIFYNFSSKINTILRLQGVPKLVALLYLSLKFLTFKKLEN